MQRSILAVWLIVVLTAVAPAAGADVSYPPRPTPHEHVYDGANLIGAPDKQAINAVAEKLLKDEDVPIIVATIDSLAQYGASGWPIERYAMNLFDEWGIGRETRNYGVLLLVSKGDRKARIELGRGYSHERDEQAAQIMSQTIVPRFKAGDFSGGIVAGVKALDSMSRQQNIPLPGRAASGGAPAAAPGRPSSSAPSYPSAPAPASHKMSIVGPLVCVGVAVVGLILISSLARRATRGVLGGGYRGYGGYNGGGWGWGSGMGSMPPWWWWIPGPGSWGNRGGGLFGGGWGSSGSSGSSSSSGGGFGGFGGGGGGGGSFGGGFSGGGGSTGSW